MSDITANMARNLGSPMNCSGEYIKEVNEVIEFYKFYDGKPDSEDEINEETTYGQLWAIPSTLDYRPSREIRNHVKKLIHKQARFMFGVPPTITLKPFEATQKDAAEQKRTVVEKVLEDSNFWANTFKAFIDCTVGKRVLLCATANPGEPIQFKYYKMSEFTYEVDPNDCTKLSSVQICYQDESTVGKLKPDERWHKWTYTMEDGACYCLYQLVDGNGNATVVEQQPVDENGNELEGDPIKVPVESFFNTKFSQIPCKVILNGGLTGDIRGTSDIKDLMDLANSYNKVNSDYRDALRFKMFEQPVFTDADSECLKKIKIAPNAIIDLKSDPTLGDGTGVGARAQASMLSSTFNFSQAAETYLDRLKKDMYELMDQPLPEQLNNVPSGKALRFLFFDLIARCEEKWTEWNTAIKWIVSIIEEACDLCNLYPELQAKSAMKTLTNIVITHNYPIPEDEESKRTVAIQEVQANVMSHKTYIRKFGDVEDEEGEWEEIMEEQDELNSSSNQGFMDTIDDELDEPIEPTKGPKQVAGEGTEEDEDEENNKSKEGNLNGKSTKTTETR